MPLLFLPESAALFVWGEDLTALGLAALLHEAVPARAALVLPEGLRDVEGASLPLLASAAQLAVLPASALETLPSSVATWTLASKLALELAARERVVPTLQRQQGRTAARWAVALSAESDATKVRELALFMPPAAHAVALHGASDLSVWAPEALLRAFLDAVVDALVRATAVARASSRAPPRCSKKPSRRATRRWCSPSTARWASACAHT